MLGVARCARPAAGIPADGGWPSQWLVHYMIVWVDAASICRVLLLGLHIVWFALLGILCGLQCRCVVEAQTPSTAGCFLGSAAGSDTQAPMVGVCSVCNGWLVLPMLGPLGGGCGRCCTCISRAQQWCQGLHIVWLKDRPRLCGMRVFAVRTCA